MLLGNSITPHNSFVYGGHTLYAVALTTTSTTNARPRRIAGRQSRYVPQPPTCNPCRVSHRPGLATSAFARHYSRNHYLFSLPAGTEMFHFPAFPPHHLYIQRRVPRHDSRWVSPFGHPRITGRLSPPRGLSQTPTSFIGSSCPGIHRTPLKTWQTLQRHSYKLLTRCSRPLCSSQETTPHHQPSRYQQQEAGRTSHTPPHKAGAACSLTTQ